MKISSVSNLHALLLPHTTQYYDLLSLLACPQRQQHDLPTYFLIDEEQEPYFEDQKENPPCRMAQEVSSKHPDFGSWSIAEHELASPLQVLVLAH